jgi:transposase-like protein
MKSSVFEEQKLYLYRAIDEHGQVIDVLLRGKRDRASAEAFFRQALARTDSRRRRLLLIITNRM